MPDGITKTMYIWKYTRIESYYSSYAMQGIKKVSDVVGLLTVAIYVKDIYGDFTKYEGDNRWKAAGITTAETFACMGIGFALAKLSLPALGVVAIGAGTGTLIKLIGDKSREWWLNSYYYIFEIHVIYVYKRKYPSQYIKQAA